MDQPSGKEPETRLVVGLSVVAILVAVGAYVIRFWGRPPGDTGDWAQFGDYLGGVVTPIVSVATLVLVARTLQLQHDELKVAINELTRAAEAQEAQAKIDARRSFDAMFFDQLAHFRKTVKALDATSLVIDLNRRYLRVEPHQAEPERPIEALYGNTTAGANRSWGRTSGCCSSCSRVSAPRLRCQMTKSTTTSVWSARISVPTI